MGLPQVNVSDISKFSSMVQSEAYQTGFYSNSQNSNSGGFFSNLFGGSGLTGNEDTFLGRTFKEWDDFANKLMSGESIPVIASLISKTAKIVKIGTGAAYVIAAAGLAMDIAAYERGDISATKFWADQGASAIGVFGEIPGAIVSGIYFGVDAFYPGGVPGANRDVTTWEYNQAHANDPPAAYQNTGVEDMPGWHR